MPKIKQLPSENELYQRLAARCAATEYAAFDIEQKVKNAGLSQDAAERIVDKLSDEGFIDEERYISAFVHDKFEFNHWGKNKIQAALRLKRLYGSAVQRELEKIDTDEYLATLTEILKAKNHQIKEESKQVRFKKLLAFAVSRGFETSLAYHVLEEEIGVSEDD